MMLNVQLPNAALEYCKFCFWMGVTEFEPKKTNTKSWNFTETTEEGVCIPTSNV